MAARESTFVVEDMPQVEGYTIEWVDERGFVLSRRNKIYESPDLRPPFKPLATFPSNYQGLLSINRVFQRLFRYLYYNVIKLEPERFLVTFQKSVGLFEAGRFVPVSGLIRPSRFLRGACAVDRSGSVYLGEYLSNPQRAVIRVYRLPGGARHLEVVHEFEPGSVRHIHGLYRDPFDDSIWLLSGDLEHECRVWRTRDGFKTIETVGEGDETWRAVSIVFREDAAFYGMDAEFRQNYVYKVDRKSLERTRLFEVDGPVYYSTTVGDHLFFGVTAEGCPSQKANRASLWSVDLKDEHERVVSFPKDMFPNILTPGTFHFPLGPGLADRVYCYCNGLSGVHGRTIRITPSSD